MGSGVCYWHESRDSAENPTVHGWPSTPNNYLARNVNCASFICLAYFTLAPFHMLSSHMEPGPTMLNSAAL